MLLEGRKNKMEDAWRSDASVASMATATRFNDRFQTTETMEQLRTVVPSAFATHQHDSRSDRYTFIPTSDVIQGLMREGFQPTQAVQSRTRTEDKKNYTKHMIRFRHPDAVTTNGASPEVVLINAHDGTSRYKLFAGLFVYICTNGLVSGETFNDISIQHKGNIVDNVIQGSFEIIGQSKALMDKVETWRSIDLTSEEQNIFAQSAHFYRFADKDGQTKTPIRPAQLLLPRRAEDAGPSLWDTFNRVQENVLKGGLTGRGSDQKRRTTRSVKGIDNDVRLNRALWMIAEAMETAKGNRQ